MEILSKIQQELKAPKGQYNAFGKYKYRSCEDILEAVKPLLGDAVLTFVDEIVYIASTPTQQFTSSAAKVKEYEVDGSRFYIKATATLRCGTESISVSAFAREPLHRTGMDDPQVTGTASSYARKYALNGLFCIDDTKDPDSSNNTPKVSPAKPNRVEQIVIDKIFKVLGESAPTGQAVDKAKVGAVIYALKGKYPSDIKKAGTIAAWLLSQGKIKELCSDISSATDN